MYWGCAPEKRGVLTVCGMSTLDIISGENCFLEPFCGIGGLKSSGNESGPYAKRLFEGGPSTESGIFLYHQNQPLSPLRISRLRKIENRSIFLIRRIK
jgi:hypothetical protein